jgi:hypothetical protein
MRVPNEWNNLRNEIGDEERRTKNKNDACGYLPVSVQTWLSGNGFSSSLNG